MSFKKLSSSLGACHLFAFLIHSAFGIISVDLFAQVSNHAPLNTENFANCGAVYSQEDTAKGELPDALRISMIQSLSSDVQKLGLQLKRKMPSNTHFSLKKCLDRKKNVLSTHIAKISDAEKNKSSYNKSLGRLNAVLERYEESVRFYRLAAKYDPQDFEAFSLGFDSWLFIVYKKLSTARNETSIKDVQDMIRESDEFILPVWNNAQAPLPLRIKLLRLRAKLWEARGRQADASSDWKKILAVEPQNLEALWKVADFEFSRGRRPEAYHLYKKITLLQPTNSLALSRLIELSLETGDLAASLSNTKTAFEANSKDPQTASLYAKALFLNNRVNEAKKIIAPVLKDNAENKMAREIQGSILEFEGDQAQREKLISKALMQYSEALKFSPNNSQLRIKMAQILYDVQKSRKFLPSDLAIKDMDEAVRLLEKIVSEGVIMENVALLYILTAARSTQPKLALKICDRYEKDYGVLPNIDGVSDCVKTYNENGRASEAQALAMKALNDPKFSENLQFLSRLIN